MTLDRVEERGDRLWRIELAEIHNLLRRRQLGLSGQFSSSLDRQAEAGAVVCLVTLVDAGTAQHGNGEQIHVEQPREQQHRREGADPLVEVPSLHPRGHGRAEAEAHDVPVIVGCGFDHHLGALGVAQAAARLREQVLRVVSLRVRCVSHVVRREDVDWGCGEETVRVEQIGAGVGVEDVEALWEFVCATPRRHLLQPLHQWHPVAAGSWVPNGVAATGAAYGNPLLKLASFGNLVPLLGTDPFLEQLKIIVAQDLLHWRRDFRARGILPWKPLRECREGRVPERQAQVCDDALR